MTIEDRRRAVSRLAHRLSDGYYAFVVANYVAANPMSINSLPPAVSAGGNPTGRLPRKDGSFHVLDLRHYLDLFREDDDLQADILKGWATGALLLLGDELERYNYFDRAPILEMVYHLRNGIAHGNQFTIKPAGRTRLATHPAHNRDAAVKSPRGVTFAIEPRASGPVLFDYMGPADVIDLLQSIEIHLSK